MNNAVIKAGEFLKANANIQGDLKVEVINFAEYVDLHGSNINLGVFSRILNILFNKTEDINIIKARYLICRFEEISSETFDIINRFAEYLIETT